MEEVREPALPYGLPKLLPGGKVSFEEFLAWCDEDTWAEWVDGEVVMLTPASRKHQRTVKFFLFLLEAYAVKHGSGEVLTAPFPVRLPVPLSRGREPDILYVSKEKLPLLKETYMDGAPDLIVEVASPESLARDRGEKYVEYEAAGVREYWLIDPERQQAEFYRLGAEGRYRTVFAGSAGVYSSEVLPGFWLKADWLWQDPPPSVVECLKEVGLL